MLMTISHIFMGIVSLALTVDAIAAFTIVVKDYFRDDNDDSSEEDSVIVFKKMKTMSINEMAKFIERYFYEPYPLIKSWLKSKTKNHQMTNYKSIKAIDINDVIGLFDENLSVDCTECPYDGKGCIYEKPPDVIHQNGKRLDCWHAIKIWLTSEYTE